MALRILQVVTVLVFVAIMWGVHQGAGAMLDWGGPGLSVALLAIGVPAAVAVLFMERRRSRSRQGKARPE